MKIFEKNIWKFRKKRYLCSPLNEGAQKSKVFFERDKLS